MLPCFVELSRTSAMISSPVCESRLPVGSSASRIDGARHQRAGDRHALALAARQLVGLVVHAVGRGRPARAPRCARSRRSSLGDAGVDQRQLHVVQRVGARQQVEGLEDEADLAVADARPARRRSSARRPCRAARSCRWVGVSRQPIRFISVDLPEPDGPHDRHVLALVDRRSSTPFRAWISSLPIS